MKLQKAVCGLLLCALTMATTGCRGTPASQKEEPSAAGQNADATPPEVQKVGENALGTDTEVLAHGDLALNGSQEILAVNRLPGTPESRVPGTIVSRATVLEEEGGTWKEIFLCDEHLKNLKGFLAATPAAEVSGWRLQFERDNVHGLVMYFTPLTKPAGGYIQTIGVRWNPKVKRYQSLDRNFEQFLGETPEIEPPMRRIG
ncbi:MAG: hypothetical protein ACRD50_14955 [Candidatus Acidiferrales bacterium]